MSYNQFLLAGVAVACLLAVFLAGCTSYPGPAGATPSPTGTLEPVMSFDQDNNGQNVSIAQGTPFSLSLPENPTTGYSWQLSHSAGIASLGDEYIPPSAQVMGAGGTHTWKFAGEERGDQTIYAEYRRPWVPSGTVTYQDIEGGFYGILGDDGKKILPLNLDARYRVDGMRVSFEYEEAGDTITIQMWGTPVNITFIEQRETFLLLVKVT